MTSRDTVKPATVRITIKTSKVQVFAPFAIRLEVGNLSFYNIDFVRSDQQITLYQGTPKAVTSVSRSTEGATLDAMGIDSSVSTDSSYQSWMLYKEFQKGTYQSSYIKLGEMRYRTRFGYSPARWEPTQRRESS